MKLSPKSVKCSAISLLLALILSLLIAPTTAQEDVLLILESDTTTLQTGQVYAISFRIDNAEDLWALEVEIGYDPELLYIMGTQAGSPIRQGAFFPVDQSVSIQNKVERRYIPYNVSMLAPFPPRQGGGQVGAFRIYPLQAGSTQLEFRQAQLATVTTITEGETTRYEVEPEPVSFVPVLLELTIQGESVDPPDEATATPLPTRTPTSIVSSTPRPLETAEPTLINVTLTPAPDLPSSSVETGEGTSLILVVALAAIVIGGGGLLVLFVIYRRRK